MSLLPTAKSAIVKDPSRTKFYVYGAPGVGKTTFATKFRKQNEDGTWAEPLFACTEEGVGFVEVYKTSIPTWQSFKDLLKELAAIDPEAKRFSCVAVDTIDLLFTMCEKHVCEAKGITHPSELEWGKGWAALKDEFQVVLSYLARLKQGMIFIGHAKIWEKKERGTSITCMQPTLSNTGRRVVLPIVDVILYIESVEMVDAVSGKTINKRLMRSEPTETIEAKDRTSVLPAQMPLDYDELAAYIRGDKKKDQPEPPAAPGGTQTTPEKKGG